MDAVPLEGCPDQHPHNTEQIRVVLLYHVCGGQGAEMLSAGSAGQWPWLAMKFPLLLQSLKYF